MELDYIDAFKIIKMKTSSFRCTSAVSIVFAITSCVLLTIAKTTIAFQTLKLDFPQNRRHLTSINDVNRPNKGKNSNKNYASSFKSKNWERFVANFDDSNNNNPEETATITRTDQYETFTEYRSSLLSTSEQWDDFLSKIETKDLSPSGTTTSAATKEAVTSDLLWEQIIYEARVYIQKEPMAGVQLYNGILLQPALLVAICTIIAYEIATELITATTIKDVFLSILNNPIDSSIIRNDLLAVTIRDPSTDTAMEAILFHKGFHALVCYRVGHRLWQSKRIGLAYYIQSIVSRVYSADIHPACRMGAGIYLRIGRGTVIGETAMVGNDVSIYEGVTLGGTGKESGDRHPKIHDGVIIYDGGTVLGNIHIGEGSIVSAKSIVTKELPPLAIASGVPAKIQSYRNLDDNYAINRDTLQQYLAAKYMSKWRILQNERLENMTSAV